MHDESCWISRIGRDSISIPHDSRILLETCFSEIDFIRILTHIITQSGINIWNEWRILESGDSSPINQVMIKFGMLGDIRFISKGYDLQGQEHVFGKFKGFSVDRVLSYYIKAVRFQDLKFPIRSDRSLDDFEYCW